MSLPGRIVSYSYEVQINGIVKYITRDNKGMYRLQSNNYSSQIFK